MNLHALRTSLDGGDVMMARIFSIKAYDPLRA